MMGSTMFVFAGNNGSGKSTIRNLIIDRIGTNVNIDPDALARRINSQFPETVRVSAGKQAILLARECIENNWDFSMETTLSGGYAIRLMREARERGFQIVMYYVGLGNPELNMERVAIRVRNGGHHISDKDILIRHETSIRNLLENLDLIDILTVIDNSKLTGEIILEANQDGLQECVSDFPEWALQIKEQIHNRSNNQNR